MKKFLIIIGCLITVVIVTIFFSYYLIQVIGANSLIKSVDGVRGQKYVLVLGTAKYTRRGKNLYYLNRIQAAYDLFKAGKVKAFLLSGDNSTKSYNEPLAMKTDLIKLGVPKQIITLDYAGFRTLDSIVRAKEVFSLEEVLIVSQKFHCERAIFLSNAHSLNSICYMAKDVKGSLALKVGIREYFARVKAVLDVYLLGTKPKFFGEKVLVKTS